jgi:hypothetical protein
MNNPFLEGTTKACLHHVSPKYNKLKNEAKTSTARSWANLTKLMLHSLKPPENSKCAATEASLAQAIPYKSEKASFRALFPHQKTTLKDLKLSFLRSLHEWDRVLVVSLSKLFFFFFKSNILSFFFRCFSCNFPSPLFYINCYATQYNTKLCCHTPFHNNC